MPERKPAGGAAFALMVFLCFLWGINQVIAKLAAPDVSLVMQAGLRSLIAVVCLYAWTLVRSVPLFTRDGTLAAGLLAGALFSAEFLFMFSGLAHTDASRMVVFVYLAPCITTLGLHWLVKGERLSPLQWAGVLLAFIGIVIAFGDGPRYSNATLMGDAFGVLTAVLWAATTIVVRSTRLANISASKVLFYQLGMAALTLPIASMLMGEPGIIAITPAAITSLAYQGIIVAFASYLAWFWLLTKYLATRLSVFTFFTPLFGVAAGIFVLREPFTVAFLLSVLLVGAGIYLVNRK
ncbi:MAG: DMT family transporter [Burkholderiales bacterium]